MKRIGTIALVATLTAALLAGTALAAGPGPGHGPGWGMHGPGYGMMQRGGPGMGMRGEFDEAKLAEIGAKLNLTTEQKPLWDAYVATVKEVSQGQ